MSEYEIAAIDSCLTEKTNIPLVITELSPSDFDDPACRKAFIAISHLFNHNEPVTLLTLYDQDSTLPADIFGNSFIAGENLRHYISKLQDQGKRKKIKNAIESSLNLIENPELELEEATHLIIDTIFNNLSTKNTNEMSTQAIGDMVLEMYKENKQKRLREEDIITLPTGIKELDSIMGGWQPGTLTVIGGRQGHGKSTLAMDFSFNLVLKEHPSLYVSLEQGRTEIFLYHIQKNITFTPLNIKQGNLKTEDEPFLMESVEKFKKLPLFINDYARTLSDVVTAIRTLHLMEGIEVVIIDYLQLIENPRKGEPRHIEVAGISRTLKQLAMQLNISIIALSQLNKEPEGRTNKKIYLSDTRESEAITQDADYVIFLYRPSIYGDERDYISLAKNRHGTMIDKIHLNYNQPYNRYEEV